MLASRPIPSTPPPAMASDILSSGRLSKANAHRPLPSVLIDFMTITLCDMVPRHPRQWRGDGLAQPLPALACFVEYVIAQAGIECRTVLVALIYLARAKKALPRGAVGNPDTCHRLFLGALLTASKFLQDTPRTTTSLSNTPSSTKMLTNRRLRDLCHNLYSLHDINQIERAFLNLIQYRCWVDGQQLRQYILDHRVDLLL